ncbi:MAG: hypothetical protein U1E32_12720, partial [Rhodoglobus sp.]|nr:hypothetical protein [Rhodoglobus sp.]
MTDDATTSQLIEWGNDRITLRLAVDSDGRVALVALRPTDVDVADVPLDMALGPVEVQLAGDQFPQGARHVDLGGTAQLRYRSHGVRESPGGSSLTLVQWHESRQARVETTWTSYDGIPVLRCQSSITNESAVPVVVEHISSFTLSGASAFGDGEWASATSVVVPHNTFFGEYQWVRQSLPSEGIYDVGFEAGGEHSTRKKIGVSSIGTQPTTQYLPMGAVQNDSLGVSWCWQIEHNGSWQWELGDFRTALYVTGSGPTDQEHHWSTTLQSGETFVAAPASIASVPAAVTDTFAPLTAYRRRIRRPNLDNVELPVVFNDYMNALVAEPTEDKLMPVIAAAAAAGAEV